MNWAEAWLTDLAARTGASVESSDISRLLEYEAGIRAGTTTQAQLDQFQRDLTTQYIMRGASTAQRAQDSQSGLYAGSDPQTEPGYVETRNTSLFNVPVSAPRPVPIASVITTLGATEPAGASPTVGPVGLAYPDDPVNYATGQTGAGLGYSGLQSGIYPAPMGGAALAAPGAAQGDNTMIYLLLAGAAVAAYFLFVK